jgi:hypothetical protein
MRTKLGETYIEVACGKCGSTHVRTLIWLDANENLVCDCGGATIVKTPKIRAALEALKTLEKLSFGEP